MKSVIFLCNFNMALNLKIRKHQTKAEIEAMQQVSVPVPVAQHLPGHPQYVQCVPFLSHPP